MRLPAPKGATPHGQSGPGRHFLSLIPLLLRCPRFPSLPVSALPPPLSYPALFIACASFLFSPLPCPFFAASSFLHPLGSLPRVRSLRARASFPSILFSSAARFAVIPCFPLRRPPRRLPPHSWPHGFSCLAALFTPFAAFAPAQLFASRRPFRTRSPSACRFPL